MPRQRHPAERDGLNHLHFITASTYRRARLFDSERFRRQFVATLAGLRGEWRNPHVRSAGEQANRKARMGRSPQTGEAMRIPAKTVVKFRSGKAFKDAVVPPKKK